MCAGLVQLCKKYRRRSVTTRDIANAVWTIEDTQPPPPPEIHVKLEDKLTLALKKVTKRLKKKTSIKRKPRKKK